ncbi:hATC-domain-containing protein, partial [Polyporus arcularius HHB13444]
DELDRFLRSPIVPTEDPVAWWWDNCREYPRLSRMAMAYLTIPGTSVDVERVFSRGRLLLPHVRNGLSSQSIRALLCLGEWSLLDLIDDTDIEGDIKGLAELDGDEEVLLEDGWDRIKLRA